MSFLDIFRSLWQGAANPDPFHAQAAVSTPNERSSLFPTFAGAVGENNPDLPLTMPCAVKQPLPESALGTAQKIEKMSSLSGDQSSTQELIYSLSLQQDQCTYAIKVFEAFASLIGNPSRFEEEISKMPETKKQIIDGFFGTLTASVLASLSSYDPYDPDNFSNLPTFLSYLKRIQQALRLCSVELKLAHSSISINRFLMAIEEKIEEIKDHFSHLPFGLRFTPPENPPSLLPIQSLPQTIISPLLGHLAPAENATQTQRAFLSVAQNLVIERLEKLNARDPAECISELIDIISFVHEAEDLKFAPTSSLEARLSALEKVLPAIQTETLQTLRGKISSFLRGEIETPINPCIAEVVDCVEEQEKRLEAQISQMESQAIAVEESVIGIDFTSIQNVFQSEAPTIYPLILSMRSNLQRSGMTQKSTWLASDKIFKIKTSYVRGEIQILVSEILPGLSKKDVLKVALASGPRLLHQPPGKVFVYKKIKILSSLRNEIASTKQALASAHSSSQPPHMIFDLEQALQKLQDNYKNALEELAKEAKISREVPDALRLWIVRKSKDPTQPQGFIMNYVDGIPLNSLSQMAPPDDPVQQLKIHTEVALSLCQALNRMHNAGYVHLAVCPENFLIENKNGSFAIKLLNFGCSVPEGSVGTKIGGLCLSALELRNLHGKSFIAHAAMDNPVLALILIQIFYGLKTKEDFEEIIKLFTHPETLRNYQEVEEAVEEEDEEEAGERGLYSKFNPRNSIWENIQILAKHMLGKFPEIDNVIVHLIDPDPESRWTAEHAAQSLQEILTKLN